MVSLVDRATKVSVSVFVKVEKSVLFKKPMGVLKIEPLIGVKDRLITTLLEHPIEHLH